MYSKRRELCLGSVENVIVKLDRCCKCDRKLRRRDTEKNE